MVDSILNSFRKLNILEQLESIENRVVDLSKDIQVKEKKIEKRLDDLYDRGVDIEAQVKDLKTNG
tara:strand:- start:323 stop:517 length:195 start_codon:yes stop_codon:yes gene_type:complete